MATKPNKKNQESESLQEQIIKLEKQLESFKHSNEHFLKNKLFLHYDVKEPEKVVVDCETKLPVLKEAEKKAILKGEEQSPTHLLLEGDNYHALSVLNYTHAGKIDVIYIDPPYNTGNKDFIYNDRFVDREDSFRHSKWLSFMAHRLRLVKNLLAQTGVIFISIDDNEQAHLRLLCDQIFGEENFVNCIAVKSSENSGVKMSHTEKKLPKIKEYLLVYARNANDMQFTPITVPKSVDAKKFNAYAKYYSKIILNPKDNAENWEIISIKKYLKDKKIRIKNNDELTQFKLKNAERVVYRTNNATLAKMAFVTKTAKVISPTGLEYIWWEGKQMLFLSDYTEESLCDQWTDISTINLNKEMVGLPSFSNGQKPIALIDRVIKVATQNKSATILDFFAGSGTTGHAVLNLNARDGGNRQFILCTNNENKIAEDVTYPRIKKVISGYGATAGIPANLRYFQTDFVEKKGSVSQLKIDLTRQCAEMICVKENVFEAVKLKKQAKNYKFFKNGNKYLGVFFDFFTDPEFADFIAELNKLPQESEKAVYIFVLDGSASIFADEFASVANCEIKEIPQKILDIYKQLAREVARK